MPPYKTFVRPKLEYAAMAGSPWLEKDVEALEKVQKRMVRMLSDVRGETYEEKLKEIGMTTLKDRRTRGDMIETYKTLSGLNNVERDRWFQIQEERARPTRPTREATEIVDGQQTMISKGTSFTVRVVDKWNELPRAINNARTLNSFKNQFYRWTETREAGFRLTQFSFTSL